MDKFKKQMAVRYASLLGENNGSKWESSLDKIFSPGCFMVEIDHNESSVGLPIETCGDDHYIVGTLLVTDSGTTGPTQHKRVTGQVLIFTSRKEKETKMFTRTHADGAWSAWRTIAQTGMYNEIANADELYATVTTLVSTTKETEESLRHTIVNYNEWKATDAQLSLSNVLADDELVKMVKSGTILTFKNTATTWKRYQYTVASAASADVQNISNWKELSAATYSIKQAVDANKVQISTTGENGNVKDIINISAATIENAGVMSVEDKGYLNSSAQGKDVPVLLRINFFNPNDEDFVSDSNLDENGSPQNATYWAVTGYIPLNSIIGQLICTRDGLVDTGNGGRIWYYDSKKQPLFFKLYHNVNGTATWESGVAYVRFSVRLYRTAHIQIERGDRYTTRIGYGESVWDEVLPKGYVEPDSLSSVFSVDKTLNLVNQDELQKGMAAYISNGEIKYTSSPSLTASGFIDVKPFTTYTFWYSGNYFFLNADKKVIGDKYDLIGAATVTTPENCRYIVINFYNTRSGMGLYNLDATARMYEGDILYPYIPYGVSSDRIQTYLQQQSVSSLGNDGVRTSRATLAANVAVNVNTHNFPHSIKNNQIAFYANFDSFDTFTIGRGFTNNAYLGCRFEITNTAITLFKNDDGWVQKATVEHGLDMNTYIKVLVSEKKNKVLVLLQTLAGSFEHEFEYWAAHGPIAAVSSTAMTDVMLSVSNPTFKCPVWMFGDSYYGVDSPNRQLYWLREWGYDNTLVQSFGGQGSTDAYNDLLKCLDFGTPKYLVWSLGMNDDNGGVIEDITTGVWYTTCQKVRKICEAMDIELILTTIPEVRGAYYNKDKMSEVVRSSGLRYIDAAKAVGCNANGEWYGNGTEYDYQSPDNVHPSKFGAKAIATQFLVDFPEIMQY